MVSRLIILIAFIIPLPRSHADCTQAFKQMLQNLGSRPSKDGFIEYDQRRLESIYPKLYQLPIDTTEKIELTRTLEFLEIENNRRHLFSEKELKFSAAYQAFVKKGQATEGLHQYYRAVVRGDLDQARAIGDKLIDQFQIKKSSLQNLHFTPNREPKTTLINYYDEQNYGVKGVRVDDTLSKGENRSKIGAMAKSMHDRHGVSIVSVPPAIQKLNSNGFSTREAAYVNLEIKGDEMVEGPMIVIPESNVEYDKISSTTKHEARHAYYNSQRANKSTSAFDSNVTSSDGSPLGKAPGYQTYQTYEEISTHSKDLLDAFRTGNREILELYKKNPTLKANTLVDVEYLQQKAKTVHLLSEQTIRTADASLVEIEKLKNVSADEIKFIGIEPSVEGYTVTLHIDQTFYLTTHLSSQSERETAFRSVVAIEDFLAAKKAALATEAQASANASSALNATLEKVAAKVKEAKAIAEKTDRFSKIILERVDQIKRGDVDWTRADYLRHRDEIAAASGTVTKK